MGAPGFWDDPESAARLGTEHARLQRRLESFRSLEIDAEDLEGLAELADEDPELAEGLEEQFASVEQRLAELEEQRLFSGRYDAGDALVTVSENRDAVRSRWRPAKLHKRRRMRG